MIACAYIWYIILNSLFQPDILVEAEVGHLSRADIQHLSPEVG